jgi:hypothetical protein
MTIRNKHLGREEASAQARKEAKARISLSLSKRGEKETRSRKWYTGQMAGPVD